ncbi:nucleoside-diphosphate sugar epimerase [Acinetobacter towneri]|uniref:nucleoside-diphosphate sugar epimerase n=1 Tax=Acinetobacter TaxID=469 RepID=UPI0015D44CA3|nr:nucleoside-diphosphate sugar epimerase [Acinetobacter sp. YH01004]
MTNSIQNAIVIGGNGLVGQQLVKQLNQLPECKNITVVLRRPCSELNRLEKVQTLLLEDFLLLNDEDVSGYSHAFSCLGTTLKKAGSKQGFYAVDYTINAHFAELLQAKGTHYILVSALGAEAKSAVFYNRVKGELEQYIESLDLDKVSILRPSLLLGERNEQRRLEDLGQKLYLKISRFIPDHFTYKPVSATQVTHTMVEAAQSQIHKFQIYDNLQIQKTK